MKIYILTDLEGVAGVNRWVQTRDGETPEKLRAMKLLTCEINAAVEGILDAAPGAAVHVLDGHGPGGTFYEEIHPDAQVIMHGDFKNIRQKRSYLVDETFDALFFVGQHAMAGTPDAPLCHTYSSKTIEYYKLNGELIGETGHRAAEAGSLGVPTVFLSGDDKACEEARVLIPNIVTVETKKGMGVELALHLSSQRACEKIHAGAAEAMRRIEEIKPYVIEPPYELEIRVLEGCDIGGYLKLGARKIDDRTVVKCCERIEQLFV